MTAFHDNFHTHGYALLAPLTREDCCFGCGSGNPSGLRMQFYRKGDEVVSWIHIPEHLCGWNGIAHGGVICTILDEVMSWAAMHLIRKLILTRSMNVEFLKPVFTSRRIMAAGRIATHISDRKAELCAWLTDESGDCCARSQGSFALFTVAAARRMKVIDPVIIEGFEHFLETTQKGDPPTGDDLEKSRISDGFVKRSGSRLANPEECGLHGVRRSDEG